MTPERYQRICRTLAMRQPDLTVITEQVHKPQNLSAIVRTCDAVGIQRIHTIRSRTRLHFNGTAKGSHRWVDMVLHDTVPEAITGLKQEGWRIYTAHQSDTAIDYRLADFTQPCALLLGAEKHGVSQQAAALADQHLVIPMQGMVESYNVSVAAAIILAEAQRQRQVAGLYQACRLSTADYQDILFRWCQPIVAEYCQRHQLAFPELNEHGEIADSAAWKVIRDAR